MQHASCLEGGPLLWIWPLYLHVNKKSKDDDDDDDDDDDVSELRNIKKYFSTPIRRACNFIYLQT